MANNNTAPATKVIIPCRISFANIWEPKSINGSDEKYSVSLLIPKDDKATLAKIKKAIEAAKEAAKEKKWNGKLPANLKMPMHDGDIDRLIEFAKRAGGIDYAYEVMKRLRDEANDVLSPYSPDETVDQQREIFDYVIERKL